MLSDAVMGAIAKLVDIPARVRYADDRHVEVTAPDHVLQRWEYFLMRKITSCAKKDQGVGQRQGGVLSFHERVVCQFLVHSCNLLVDGHVGSGKFNSGLSQPAFCLF